MKIKLDLDSIRLINTFESLTRAKVKHCSITSEKIIFIVNEGEIAKAIGKKGENIKRLEHLVKKKVKVIEFSPDPTKYIGNVIRPLKLANIETNELTITMEAIDSRTRGVLIGRNASNLRAYENLVKLYYPNINLRVK